MLPVVALIKAKPGKEKELKAMLKDLVGPTRKEVGCIRYDLHGDQGDARLFVFVEMWKSDEALQSHLASPHIAAGMARKDELIESLEIRSLVPINAG